MAGLIKPVVIAGGGLAGLSLGIALLRRGAAVTLHEAGKYPRHRVCGEFISGVTSETLENLGVASHFDDAMRLTSSLWFDGRGAIANLRVSGLGISRWELDDRLQKDFIKSGGILKTGSRIAPGDGIVWAAGRVRTEGRWIGVKCHARELPLASDLEMHLGTNGYVGLARIGKGLVNVCGLFRRQKGIGGREALIQCLQAGGLDSLAERLSRALPDPESFCAVAGFRTGRQDGPPFSIGDAARMIPPFTGNGMTMAFESAESALGPLLEYCADRISWQEAALLAGRAQDHRFARRMRVAWGLHSLLTSRPALVASLARWHLIPCRQILRFIR